MTDIEVEGITAVGGVEVDISVSGEEDRANKVVTDLKERLGILGAAYATETPPDELDDIPQEYTPPMSVAWDRVFEGDSND
jgi:hypothetical protein